MSSVRCHGQVLIRLLLYERLRGTYLAFARLLASRKVPSNVVLLLPIN
ncbi:hypothetical protein GCHA_0998 [Paraglaciecola chathamensis S18K6]|uniref:Uncharacterized protein n=1 Tax=Paraglaciecola chathamensis S18K6 TaxID=1127672 RepID=A0AAV3UV48_9ALTE|nr:hypothetical protein GCHA_0998 [Paraglaciecola chathamensis S18K6]